MSDKNFKEGDIIYTKAKDSKYDVYKILKIDDWPDESKVWHVLSYHTLDKIPTISDIKSLKPFIWHSPISSFNNTAVVIANRPVTKEDLFGYYEYLKLTDPHRYHNESSN